MLSDAALAIKNARDLCAKPIGAVRFGLNLYTVEVMNDNHGTYEGQSTAPYELIFLVSPDRERREIVGKDEFAQMLPYARLEVIS